MAAESSPGIPALAAGGPLSFRLVQWAKAHKAVAAGLLRQLGLYPGQELLLIQLHEQDGLTQTELVRRLNIDASTVARMAVRLEANGFIRREVSTGDRRAVVVSLTPQGAEACEAVGEMWAELEARTVAGLSAEERRTLLRLVGKAAAAL